MTDDRYNIGNLNLLFNLYTLDFRPKTELVFSKRMRVVMAMLQAGMDEEKKIAAEQAT